VGVDEILEDSEVGASVPVAAALVAEGEESEDDWALTSVKDCAKRIAREKSVKMRAVAVEQQRMVEVMGRKRQERLEGRRSDDGRT